MNCKNKSLISKRKAFTLIELLIVIAIIGILFIVLVSKVDFATDKAKATGVQTDFRSFQVAIESVAKENAGLATFGWDTGDTNGDRVRNSYDRGDTNKNGKQDPGEVFIGSKTYGETWTNIYTLTNPADAKDKSAIVALEEAINKNLDPKLHITIHDDLTITMANGAQDPWNTEYHGYYITNATVDNKDRGAIVMYSNGANQEFGSEHSISNGIVIVNVPGNNVYGKDDYSIAVFYTYLNGYGEVKTSTSGFSNNQTIQGNVSNNSGTEETADPDVTELLDPGLYNAGAIELAKAGDVEAAQNMIKTSWTDLLSAGIVHVTNGVVYSNLDLDTWENSSSASLDGDLVLPDDGSITSIGDAIEDDFGNIIGNIAFASCYELTGIAIPKGVTSIDFCAFEYCENLSNIVIPDSITSIGDYAFDYCENLSNIVIPDSVTSIGSYAFYCTSLTSIVIPDSVTSIGSAAFAECTKLTSMNISNSLTDIDICVFDNCTSLQYNEHDNAYYLGNNNNPYVLLVKAKDTNLTSINIHSNTKVIYSYAFYDCTNLTSMTIPDSVTNIGPGAFQRCLSLTSVVIPKNVTSIGYDIFYYCPSLTSVTISDSVTNISDRAFGNCTSLTSIEIPDSVTSICPYAFSGCTSLTSITIPDSITSIGSGAFIDCSSLENITVGKGNTVYHNNGNCLIETATKTLILGCKNSVIPTDGRVTSIGPSAFSGCTSLKSIVIPDSVTSIGDSAFSGCQGLASVTIPNSVTSIDQWAFRDCSSLKSIVIHDSVANIGERAFWGCTSLTSATIPNSVTSIGESTFYYCTSLASIYFNGTKSEWSSISKEYNWNYNVPATYVQCTDGQVTIE